jgi:2,3-bisphosphoglycerate-dependent phosphoglycerate mutase
MSKILYIVRHCKATGQRPDAPLTAEGLSQAEQLADQLAALSIERIISSPFLRATQSAAPIARRLGLPVATDERLQERALSDVDLPDWMAALQSSFEDLDRCFEGGESSRAAMRRAIEVVDECLRDPAGVTLLVTHGNLMTLLLMHFDPRIGFEDWRRLTNPDVYRIVVLRDRVEVARVWS